MEKQDFIKGKWYKWLNHSKGSNCLVYFKYSHKEGNNYYYTDRINYKEGHCYLNTYVNPHFPHHVEVSISEIAQYLPPNHPDLKLLQSENSLQTIEIW